MLRRGRHILVFLWCVATLVAADDIAEEDEARTGHLLTKLDCVPGQQFEYIMATQSSMLDKFEDANMLVKTKLAVRCVEKRDWLNTTSDKTHSAQVYEAKILSVTPLQLAPGAVPSLKTGQLQMANLFDVLEKTPSSYINNDPKQPNIKVGAVSDFFEKLGSSLGDLLMEVFRRLVKVFEQLIQKRKDNPMSKTVPASLTCPVKDSSRTSRRFIRSAKSLSFSRVNDKEYRNRISELFRLPWTFVQLEEGAVVETKLSPLESSEEVKNFKQFISGAFSTQLDEQRQEVVEKSQLGKHRSHYQIEYEQARNSPIDLLHEKRRSRRYAHPVVSVVRSVRAHDILKPHGERNHLRHRKLYLEDMDFTAQQVQLVEGNVLVASGGHFRSVMPLEMSNERVIRRERRSLRDEFDSHAHFSTFDDNLRHALTMNLEYSMVKVDTKKNKKRSRRHVSEIESVDETSPDASFYSQRMNDALNRASKSLPSDVRRRRTKREEEKPIDSSASVKCDSLPQSQLVELVRQIEREGANFVGVEPSGEAKQCHEHKEFGTRLLKAYFNRTVTSRGIHKDGKPKIEGRDSGKEYFDTHFKIGAQFMGEDLLVGQVHLASHQNRSRLALNLFGSEYVNLDLCEIRNKTFSQANLVPLFNENIWFMTNVAVKIKYEFDFNMNVPDEICAQASMGQDKSTVNADIVSRMANNELNTNFAMQQNSKLDVAAAFDASFLIFNAEMKVNGHFDMNSDLDFGPSCLSAKSNVQPMNVTMDFNYKFFHPVCNEWMEDNWRPRELKWELTPSYRSSWFDNVCFA